jgi:hypothetical protein
MTGTRYPDMICMSMVDTEEAKKRMLGHRRHGGRAGAPVRNPLPAIPQERPVKLTEYADWELGAMIRMACDLDGEGAARACEIADDLDLETAAGVARTLDTIRDKLIRRELGNHGRPRKSPEPKGITEEQQKKAEELRALGLSWRAVAEEVGESIGKVRYSLTGA